MDCPTRTEDFEGGEAEPAGFIFEEDLGYA